MPDEQPTLDRASAEAYIDRLVLDLLIDDDRQRPLAVAEIVREHGEEADAIDAIDRLYAHGLIHKTSDGFVFASRAAVRYHELPD